MPRKTEKNRILRGNRFRNAMFGMALLIIIGFFCSSLKSIIENYSFGPQSLLILIYLLIQSN
jgi:hypothetical protein